MLNNYIMEYTIGTLDRFKQPQYIGENRCFPCTVVNGIFAIMLSIGVSIGTIAVATPLIGVASGVTTLILCALSIYFRGYLIPGTPQLTKRYFPVWLLTLFKKNPSTEARKDDFNPETELASLGAIKQCPESDDLCLTDWFRSAWHVELERLNQPNRKQLLELLDVEEGGVEYEEYDGAFQAHLNGNHIGTWESKAAFLADFGAAKVMQKHYSDWTMLTAPQRSQLLQGLRVFIDTCPMCGGKTQLRPDTVESCCKSHEVACVSCTDCGARLFESAPLHH
jgi:hypothetical protein